MTLKVNETERIFCHQIVPTNQISYLLESGKLYKKLLHNKNCYTTSGNRPGRNIAATPPTRKDTSSLMIRKYDTDIVTSRIYRYANTFSWTSSSLLCIIIRVACITYSLLYILRDCNASCKRSMIRTWSSGLRTLVQHEYRYKFSLQKLHKKILKLLL